MATRNASDYDRYSRVEPGISRGGAPSGRSGAPRQASAQRRPASGQRPAPGGQRRPPQRSGGQPPRRTPPRRRKKSNMPVIVAVAALALVIVLVVVIVKPFGRPKADPVVDALPASNPVQDVQQPVDAAPQGGDTAADTSAEGGSLADRLADSNSDVGSLSAADMAQVSDLRINTSLPDTWLNVLLLGTDERMLSDSARTDSMIICSINRTTGELKLASIMRDLAIEYTDIGQWNGLYRINAANFFGGSNLAMRTVNEKFKMNIQYYAMVNFYGFQRIAEKLGGIDIDITEDEMNEINKNAYKAYKNANKYNVDISDVEWVKLETYGENVHLNGTQTLAYARIRKLQGGDYMRSQRQRTVLGKLLDKVKKLDAIQMAALATDMLKDVRTNLPLDDLFPLAIQVCSNGLSGIKSLQLPVSGTYKEETRNNQSMLYDCDFDANAIQLYNFIYEN